jgi:acetyltransferase (GNAT) family protein
VSVHTEAGLLTIARAGTPDFDAVIAILREAADWLLASGNPQWDSGWKHWHDDIGERVLRYSIEHHEVYLACRDGAPVATLRLHWEDAETWGERGDDGSAGYIHAIAIKRSIADMRVGDRLLEWAVDTIARAAAASHASMRWLRTPLSVDTTRHAVFDR